MRRRTKKIITVFGTRPEAIKLAPVIKALEKQESVDSIVCVTSQHREMLDQVLRVFEIKPQYDLDIMKPGQSLTHVTAEVLVKVEQVLSVERPDLLLVQGDTTTTFAAALAAFYCKVKVGHVEAGLRSFDRYQPFPEEINRSLTSDLVDYHFAPTPRARENLLKEGVAHKSIVVTGNTGIDALFMTLASLREEPQECGHLTQLLESLDGSRLVLVTAHRRENFGVVFEDICKAVRTIVERYPDVVIVYPVHLNPHIAVPASRMLSGHERIKLLGPLEYIPFVKLLERAHLILTDSGGIQEEAPSLGKPVLVMRNVTERPEAIKAGSARLIGTTAESITREVQRLLEDPVEYQRMATVRNPFGDGRASRRIVDHILKKLS